MKITTTTPRPPNGNPGIVPPWLQNPIHTLPMPGDWKAPVPTGTFEVVAAVRA